MAGTLVDANILLDIFTEDDEWFDWSASMLEEAAHAGRLYINPIIYAETSARFTSIEELDEALPLEYYHRAALPWGQASWPARRTSGTGKAAATVVRRSPTSTLVRSRQSPV